MSRGPDGTCTFRASRTGAVVLVVLTAIMAAACLFVAALLVPIADLPLVLFLLAFLPVASVGILFTASPAFDAAVSRIDLRPDGSLRLRLPTFRGPLAWLPIVRREIAPADISMVEVRREVQRSAGLAWIVDAAALRLADGERIVLARTSDRALVGMPVATLAAAIAETAKKPLIDHGTVDRGPVLGGFFRDRALSWDAPGLDPAAVGRLQGAAARTWAIVGVLVSAAVLVRACAGG
jgi:hypothetical protein